MKWMKWLSLNNEWDNHADTLDFSVSLASNDSTLTCWTSEYHSFDPSSSVLFLEILTLTLLGKFLIPWFQINWLSLGSILTSYVFIILATIFLISDTALGAFFLNWILWAALWILIVVSIAHSVKPFLYSFFPIYTTRKFIIIKKYLFNLTILRVYIIFIYSIFEIIKNIF